jgi:hypothetical protein
MNYKADKQDYNVPSMNDLEKMLGFYKNNTQETEDHL